MTAFIKKKLKDREGNYLVTPSSADIVYCSDGETVATKLRKVENDEFSPTITQMSSVSKVGVGEDIDISDNTQEGYLKSAILKGQTLVNILTEPITNHTFTTGMANTQNTTQLQANKKYIAFIDIANVTNEATGIYIRIHNTHPNGNGVILPIKDEKFTVGLHKLIFTMPSSSYNEFEIMIGFVRNAEATVTYNYAMVIEYQDGMENWDIPYFEGMQSVKMPVLTTMGKNLFDKSKVTENSSLNGSGGLNQNVDGYCVSDFIEIRPNTNYVKSNTHLFSLYDENKNFIERTGGSSFTTLSNAKYVRVNVDSDLMNEFQLEKGTVATSYEPFKTNILSTSEDVELRGIGDVQDELNLLTGEVTERIGEIVLDGSLTYTKTAVFPPGTDTSIYSRFYIENIPNYNSLQIVADNFRVDNYNYIGERIECGSNGRAGIMILKSRLATDDADGLKMYLSSNPITVQYQLATESIKTVDLEPLGTNPTTQPYVWKDGHIQLSSEEGSLLPTLDYSVTTSRGGQILENTKHIAKQDKRIYDLEMLMINSSVEDAYQRLLLQNDVQVMSRMDETHLNPMRYYMLTRLIEEKMYEETDMLNKLDTFFLYGDISSDQYFELMDKIFGMEEIVEEDFTEEK